MSERATVVQVFAKCPGHGRPKTRLQPPLSQAEASCLHWQLTTLTVQLAARFTTHVELWLDRESTHPWVLDLIEQSGCRVRCQPEGNLGVRMAFAMQSALTEQARVLLVGSDCPVLDLPLLEQAEAALNAGNDYVFSPSEDGGYALIGATQLDSAVFAGIDWGQDTVMRDTRNCLRAAGRQFHETRTVWDVDRPEDLQRLHREGIPLPELAVLT